MKPLTVSVTELQSFQTCKRQWLLGRQWGSAVDAPELWLGIAVHKGLEGLYRARKNGSQAGESPEDVMHALYERYLETSLDKIAKAYGVLWPQASPLYESLSELGRRMLANYMLFDQEAETQFVPIVTEKRVYVKIGKNTWLTAQLDVVLKEVDTGFIYITDHKTSSGSFWTNTAKGLDIDMQLTGYAYCLWRITGQVFDVMYNVLIKESPEPPAVLSRPRNGCSLSTNKAQKTTASLYRKAIEENGEDPDDYEEMLEILDEKGWADYFYREASPRNETQVRNFEWYAQILIGEMRACLEDPSLAIPAPQGNKCNRCPFLSVCNAMEDGSDYEALLESSFKKMTDDPYTTPERMRKDTNGN